MCRELEEMGIRLVVSVWPTINPSSENYQTMSEANMLVRTENGQFGTFDFYGQQTFVDVMNPGTRKFVWNKIKENYYQYGIRSFWLDEAEPEVHPQQPAHLRYYLGNGAQVAQLYPFYYAKMFLRRIEGGGGDGDHLPDEGGVPRQPADGGHWCGTVISCPASGT